MERQANDFTQYMNEAETGGSVLRASNGWNVEDLAGQ